MKIKTSVTLSKDIIKAMNKAVGKNGNRSALVEDAVHAYLVLKRHEARNAHDFEIINRNAAKLNKEALDTLSYQVKL